MEIFTAVAQAQQITRGAERLNLSKSAVSTALADLETYLGVQLIARDNRNFQLTDVGRDYLEHCVRILGDIEEIEDSTRSVNRELGGPIRLTAPITYGATCLPAVLAGFLNDHPRIDIKLDLTDRFVDLSHENVDVAIRIGELSDSELIARPVSRITMRMVASPDFLKANKVTTLSELKQTSCLRYSGTPNWQLRIDGTKHTFSPRGCAESNNGEALREFAVAGQGIAYLPDFLVEEAVSTGRLVDVFDVTATWSYEVYAVYRRTRHRPARVRLLIDYLTSTLK